MHILMADDTPDTLLMYCLAFTLAGHEVQLAHDGAEALAMVATRNYDVILVDIEMPCMNGWEVSAAIRQLPQHQHVPIVLFTSYYDADHEHRSLKVGADRVVEKPVMPSVLLQIMAQLVAERTAKAAI
ncbi:MAG: hypothetical protein JWN98_1957 [Abditibacteriota bacterium]|nr:hypothetical protein [Abditibacteriota bacterium]